MKFEYLFLDADNTLWDFDLSEKFALFKVLSENGVEFEPAHLIIYHEVNKACWQAFENGTLDAADLKARRFELFCEKFDYGFNADKMGKNYLHYLGSTDFMVPGALNLLDRTHSQRKLVLVTNGIKEVQRRRISNTGIEKYFDAIVISDEIGVAKPNTGFFDYAFNEVGSPPKEKVLMVGDSLSSDIRGGNNYGLTTCWYNPKNIDANPEILPTIEIKVLDKIFDII